MHASWPCGLCGSDEVRLLRDRAALAADLQDARASGHKLMHSAPADVFSCDRCGSLSRGPADLPGDLVGCYRDDEYGARELLRLHEVETTRCAADRRWLTACGVSAGSRVLEVGSYVGGLLSFARGVGCAALGVDVGREVCEFGRDLGLDVLMGELEPGMFPRAGFDAVLVLNCFEQLPDPLGTLHELRRLVCRGGVLVVRTPNADFVRGAHRPASRPTAQTAGVLGVPFVRCLTPAALLGTLRSEGFAPVSLRGDADPWMDVAARAA